MNEKRFLEILRMYPDRKTRVEKISKEENEEWEDQYFDTKKQLNIELEEVLLYLVEELKDIERMPYNDTQITSTTTINKFELLNRFKKEYIDKSK